MQQQKKQSLKAGHHVLTVRMPTEDFKHLKAARERLVQKDRRKWTYTEIIVGQIRRLAT
jgi:hypothetical protein